MTELLTFVEPWLVLLPLWLHAASFTAGVCTAVLVLRARPVGIFGGSR